MQKTFAFKAYNIEVGSCRFECECFSTMYLHLSGIDLAPVYPPPSAVVCCIPIARYFFLSLVPDVHRRCRSFFSLLNKKYRNTNWKCQTIGFNEFCCTYTLSRRRESAESYNLIQVGTYLRFVLWKYEQQSWLCKGRYALKYLFVFYFNFKNIDLLYFRWKWG